MSDNESEHRNDTLHDDHHLPPDEVCRPDHNVFQEMSELPDSIPDHVYHVRCANLGAGLHPDAYLYETNDSADLYYSKQTVKLVQAEVDQILLEYDTLEFPRQEIQARPGAIPPVEADGLDCAHVEQHFLVNKKAVIERDTDLLTSDEVYKHREEVTAAILAELKTWLKFKCFEHRAPWFES
jgi:hypothetical protein